MPVHIPGPRLYRSVPFKYLAQVGAGGGGNKDANVHLNLTPFVDMMTILVTFLLMVFSATGDIITNPKGLELPDAVNKDQLQKAPVIIITQEDVSFQGEHMAETDSVFDDTSPQWKIVELYERLKAEKDRFEVRFEDLPDLDKQRCEEDYEQKPGKYCLRGLAILQADRNTPAKVINRVLKTANAAGYNNLMFAVNRRGRG